VAVETSAGGVRVEPLGVAQDDVRKVGEALERAGPRLAQWGELRERVTVRLHPSHTSLSRAVEGGGFPWMRAWARYDVIELQTPRSWGVLGARQREVDELILHELTHCLMYQLAADRLGWSRKGIPVWFREGMASYTADQGYRWPTLETLARFLDAHPRSELLSAPNALHEEESSFVYAAGHHAFTFLVRRYGEDVVRALLREMRQGPDFPAAFRTAVGLAPDAFEREFLRYVRWRGFKGGRLIRRPEGAPDAGPGDTAPPAGPPAPAPPEGGDGQVPPPG
jgi:hypothetical protein